MMECQLITLRAEERQLTSNSGSGRGVVKDKAVDSEQAMVQQPLGKESALSRDESANSEVVGSGAAEVDGLASWWVGLECLLVVSGLAVATEVEGGVASDKRMA
jgi:hypothetical protein